MKVLSASYFKYSDERQLIDDDDDDEWLADEDEDNNHESAGISVKHVHFVTDASLSSWKDQDAVAFYSSTGFGYVDDILCCALFNDIMLTW